MNNHIVLIEGKELLLLVRYEKKQYYKDDHYDKRKYLVGGHIISLEG
jgi:hypothetical protein